MVKEKTARLGEESSPRFLKLDDQMRKRQVHVPRLSLRTIDAILKIPGLPPAFSRILLSLAAALTIAGCALGSDFETNPPLDKGTAAASPDAGGAGSELPDPNKHQGKRFGVIGSPLTVEGYDPLTAPEPPAFDKPEYNYRDTAQGTIDGVPYLIMAIEDADGAKLRFTAGTPENPEAAFDSPTAKLVQGLGEFESIRTIACFGNTIFFQPHGQDVKRGAISVDAEGNVSVTDITTIEDFGVSEMTILPEGGVPFLYFSIGASDHGKFPIDDLTPVPSGVDGSCSLPALAVPPKDEEPGVYFGGKDTNPAWDNKECKLYASASLDGIATSPYPLTELDGDSSHGGHVSTGLVFGTDGKHKKTFVTFIKKVAGKFKIFKSMLKASETPLPDTIPPAQIMDLTVGGETETSIDLYWTAPGDDGSEGTAQKYEVRYSGKGPITDGNWGAAAEVTGAPDPSVAGTPESMTVNGLEPGTEYNVAIRAVDDEGNKGQITNVSATTVTPIPDKGPDELDTSGTDADVQKNDGIEIPDEGPQLDGGDPPDTKGDAVLPDSLPPKDEGTETNDAGEGPDVKDPPPKFESFKIPFGGCTFTVEQIKIGEAKKDRVKINGGTCKAEIRVEGFENPAILSLQYNEGTNTYIAHCDFPVDGSAPTCQKDSEDALMGITESGHGVVFMGDGYILVASGSSFRVENTLRNEKGERIVTLVNEEADSGLLLTFDGGKIFPIVDAGIFEMNLDMKTLKPKTVQPGTDTTPQIPSEQTSTEPGGCSPIILSKSTVPSSVPAGAFMIILLTILARLRRKE